MDEPIPTGRYAIISDRQTVYIRLTRSTTQNWTKIFISDPDGAWIEIHKPETRAQIIARLRTQDLPTASCLYTSLSGFCGICGRANHNDHDGCLARKFGEEAVARVC